jgi:hypothetical protein
LLLKMVDGTFSVLKSHLDLGACIARLGSGS